MVLIDCLDGFSSCADQETSLRIISSPEVRRRLGFEKNLSEFQRNISAQTPSFNKILRFLGFDFAFVHQNKLSKDITIGVGHRSVYKIYYRKAGESLEVRSSLVHLGDQDGIASQMDVDWIKYFFATGLSCGPAEVIPTKNSVLKSWFRVPPGHILRLSNNGSESLIPFDNITAISEIHAPCIQATRDALECNLAELSGIGSVACEFSGGIDSGIVLSSASKQLRGFRGGITAAYPFHEFRREALFRDAILDLTGAQVEYVNYFDMLPFSHINKVPLHDEPSINSTSWGQFSSATSRACEMGASVLLTGHAGDNLFGIDPSMKIVPVVGRNMPNWLPKSLLDDINDASNHIGNYLNRPIGNCLGGFWHPSILESGFLQRYGCLHGTNVRYVSGLMSPDFINALRRVWLTNPPLEKNVQKPIAHYVFSDLLPSVVWNRPGKVNHLGNVYRGAMQAKARFNRLSESLKVVCELLEINYSKTLQWVNEICDGQDSGNQFFTQLISIVIWLDRCSKPIPNGNAID